MKIWLVALLAVVLGSAPVRAADDSLAGIVASERTRTFTPELAAALLDGDVPTAARAALAMGRARQFAAVTSLRWHLETSQAPVRAMSAYALGLLDDEASLRALRHLARADRSGAVRYAAVDAIGRIVAGDPRIGALDVVQDTLIVVRSDVDPVVRAHAAAALDAFTASPRAWGLARAIERAFKRERNTDVRWHLMWVLFRGYAKAADWPFLADGLRDRSELVRIEALRAVARHGDPQLMPQVLPLLRDPSWRVQYEAREVLLRLSGRKPTEHLKAVPPGMHLPAAALAVAAPTAAPSTAPDASPSPAPSAVPTIAAPVASELILQPVIAPQSARDMNGPANGMHPRAQIVTTQGTIVVRLLPEWAPVTVANFLGLADRRYFDGTRWFRVVPDFVVQGGDRDENGNGNAGYTIPAEENPLEQRSGVISMGLDYNGSKALRDSAATQFYITISPQLHLDRDFTVFGTVESGFSTIARLTESDRILRVVRIDDD